MCERPFGAYCLVQPEVKADSATSILARGVKRGLRGGLPPDCYSNRDSLCPEELRDGPTACKALKAKQTSLFPQAGQQNGMAAKWSSTFEQTDQHDQPVTWFKRITMPSSTWQLLEECDAEVAVDVDCCGDSGSMSKLSVRSPAVSACAV